MSELKKQKILEEETLKEYAREITSVLLMKNILFEPSLVNTHELSFQMQVLDLVKSNLRREQKSLTGKTKNATTRQIKQRIDMNIKLIAQYKEMLLDQYHGQPKVQKWHIEKNTTINVVDDEIMQQIYIEEQNFQNKYTNRVERLQQMKILYDKLLAQTKRNYRLLEKVIEINCEKNNTFFLPDLLNQLLETKNNLVILLKKIYYMENIIYQEKKKEQKCSSEDIFVSKGPLVIEEDRETEEINPVESLHINNYIDKIKKCNDLEEVIRLLNCYPELYEVKSFKNRYIFEDILTDYFNILINRDTHITEVRKKMEYLNRLIAMHSNFGAKTGNEFCSIIQSKISHVIDIVEKNNYRNEKKQEILQDLSRISNQLHYYQQLNVPRKSKKKYEIQKEAQIITIDNQQTKVFEDALSIYKTSSIYYLTLYVTDVASFVKNDSVEDRCARDSFTSSSGAIFSKDQYQRFSLTQGFRRYAYAYTFALTENMEVREFIVKKVRIRVSKNFNFKQASIACNNKNSKYYETMRLLTEVSEKINREKDLNICKNRSLTSGALVEIPVLFAKNFITEYCIENQLPIILQRNDCNGSDGISKWPDETVYSSLGKKNGSLLLEFTSPARSYISLLNQRLHNQYFISEKLREDKMPYLVGTIKEVCNEMNQDKYDHQKVLK